MLQSQDNKNDTFDKKNTKTDPARNQVHQVLVEFGLDPSDYIFSSSQELLSDQDSPQKQSSITSGRPLSYVQQSPPPNIDQKAAHIMSQQEHSSRRTPPPPPLDSHTNDSNLSAEDYLRRIDGFENPPVKVIKPNTQNIVYRKEIRIRYLQPPTPPAPGPIIIREKQLPPLPPESPLLIRERKSEALTPPPLTICERPPTPPRLLEPYVVEKLIPPPRPQPRQIIIERLPTPPPKPRTVIFEKWLPYKKVKRPVLLEKAPPMPPVRPTRNVIIEYEPSKAYIVRRVIEEGIFRVDPYQYTSYHTQSTGDVRIVDRIDDLPPPSEELRRILHNYNQPNSSNYQVESSSNTGQLADLLHSSSTPVHQKESVLSTGHDSSVSTPTTLSRQTSQTKN